MWIIYLAADKKGWASLIVLLVVASHGFGMLALWLQRRQATPAIAGAGGSTAMAEGGPPAEQHFPGPSSLETGSSPRPRSSSCSSAHSMWRILTAPSVRSGPQERAAKVPRSF